MSITVDLLLACSAPLLAAAVLLSRQLFTGIVLFICLGLLVTLVWARLGAWDVALAEAAIGAGLTGTLLLGAWRRLQGQGRRTQKGEN